MSKSESFIEGRIWWRAGMYGLPEYHTKYVEDLNKDDGIHISDYLGKPVLLLQRCDEFCIVLCTFEALVKNKDVELSFSYNDIELVSDLPMEESSDFRELEELIIFLKNGKKIHVFPEPHKPAFAIWNILMMLQRLNKRYLNRSE